MKNRSLIILMLTIVITTIPTFAKYYCESDELIGEYIPNLSEACVHWKEIDMRGMYNTCVNANKMGEKAFRAGQCELIIEKTYTKGNELCVDQITQKTKRVIGTACVGK